MVLRYISSQSDLTGPPEAELHHSRSAFMKVPRSFREFVSSAAARASRAAFSTANRVQLACWSAYSQRYCTQSVDIPARSLAGSKALESVPVTLSVKLWAMLRPCRSVTRSQVAERPLQSYETSKVDWGLRAIGRIVGTGK